MDAAIWTSDEWLTEAGDWLDKQLAAAGTHRVGELTQPRVRAWGTVLRADTPVGPVWLKAPGPETVFEVPLYRVLATVAPKWVLDPIALDVDRGWVLLPDGGPTLGDILGDEGLSDAMVQVLPQYAQLQLDLMPHAEDLLAAGVVDMRAGDAYLEVFGRPADLLEEFELASWIGKVARSLVWERSLHGDPGRFIDVPLEVLGSLRMNSWLDPA